MDKQDSVPFYFIKDLLYFFYPNLHALSEPQEDEYVIVKTETWGRWSALLRAYFEYPTSRLYDIFSKLKLTKEI